MVDVNCPKCNTFSLKMIKIEKEDYSGRYHETTRETITCDCEMVHFYGLGRMDNWKLWIASLKEQQPKVTKGPEKKATKKKAK